MNNGHIAERISVLALEAAALQFAAYPDWTDAKIAKATGLERSLVNRFRLVWRETPQHVPEVLSGKMLVDRAVKLRRKMREIIRRPNGTDEVEPGPLPDLAKLRADLLAWISLTRELLDSVEATILGSNER